MREEQTWSQNDHLGAITRIQRGKDVCHNKVKALGKLDGKIQDILKNRDREEIG